MFCWKRGEEIPTVVDGWLSIVLSEATHSFGGREDQNPVGFRISWIQSKIPRDFEFRGIVVTYQPLCSVINSGERRADDAEDEARRDDGCV